jgi:DUF1009 family protein
MMSSFSRVVGALLGRKSTKLNAAYKIVEKQLTENRIGIIAGSSSFPMMFAKAAQDHGYSVVACCHKGETSPEIESIVERAIWIKLGELGRIIDTFKEFEIKQVALAGGVSRVNLFGIKLDSRGAKLLARLKSVKDDIVMRGIADELKTEGIEVIECTRFMENHLAKEGLLTKRMPTEQEMNDIHIGIRAVEALSAQDIGQTVVVKEGVVIAVEAVEGTDRTIKRGGELAGANTVVVKYSKTTQDLRFDVPTVGLKTITSLISAKSKVLAVEAGRCLILDQKEVLELADKHDLSIIVCSPLDRQERGNVYS